jgi:NAD(P)-dependent dehydrogenase (short-subunit alcohol dehydrogenase family)
MSIATGRFAGKAAVVTGGESGIGLAITRLLIAEGACAGAGDVKRTMTIDVEAHSWWHGGKRQAGGKHDERY